MPPKQQVCSLEPSKKLRGLGVKQESLFYWTYTMNGVDTELTRLSETIDGVIASAFTVAELGEMLPHSLREEQGIEKEIFLTIHRCVGGVGWNVNYESTYDDQLGLPIWADTEADARAKMLIHLLENNLIK